MCMRRNIKVPRLQEKFIDLCWRWMADNRTDKTGLGKTVDLPHPRISELLKRKRTLTMYYVERFVKKGVFMVDDIYDGKAENKGEEEAWEYLKLCEDRELLTAIGSAFKGGLKRDVLMQILKSHFSE